MTEVNPSLPPTPEEERAFEARAAFKSFVHLIGLRAMDDLIESAKLNQERGLKGITVPSEGNAFWVTIDEEVSFRVEDYGPYRVPMDTALAALYELHVEAQEKPQQNS